MKNVSAVIIVSLLAATTLLVLNCQRAPLVPADMILHHGAIITVDPQFSIHEAVAILRDRIYAVGANDDILSLAGPATELVDLNGRTVLPGLHEHHVHPDGASISELMWGPIPNPKTVQETLDWVKAQAAQKKPGEWIVHAKLFPTRLKELRMPTLQELDAAAPQNPVFLGSLGYDGMVNSHALRISGITKRTTDSRVLKDEHGELTGFIRTQDLLKGMPDRTAVLQSLTVSERQQYLEKLFHLYNEAGITSITVGSGSLESLKMYRDLRRDDRLTVRICQNVMAALQDHAGVDEYRKTLAAWGTVTGVGDEWVRVGALKVVIDGGFLTGTAHLKEPWGMKARDIYGIIDPDYRGTPRITREALLPLVTAATELGWKFTAHVAGGAAAATLLDVYEEVNTRIPVKERRHSLIHANFLDSGDIARMQRLGIYADCQQAFFYIGAYAMNEILGPQRVKDFHPYRSLFDAGVTVHGGSDHMIGLDANEAIAPYNPFLGMWAAVTHTSEMGVQIVPEEAITREEALRLYTINNARGTFEENIKGSIEAGKLADMIVVSANPLTCPVDELKGIQVEMTMVGGRLVYQKP